MNARPCSCICDDAAVCPGPARPSRVPWPGPCDCPCHGSPELPPVAQEDVGDALVLASAHARATLIAALGLRLDLDGEEALLERFEELFGATKGADS